MNYHEPVLLNESIDGLNIKPDGVYVDVTFGGGGHSREILKRLDENGKLVGFDQDPDALKNAIQDQRFTLVNQNFQFMHSALRSLGIQQVDGILGDLGVSSHQFDTADRGFSLRFDAPLDMRMDQKQDLTAEKIINGYEYETLARLLREFGEVDKAGKIAAKIIASRPIATSAQLLAILEQMAPGGKEHKFYAQVFQALRIEVNNEINVLKELLDQSLTLIKPGGRLVIISYHSLEDRLVKNFMRSGDVEGKMTKDFFGNLIRPFKPIQSKSIVPSENEIAQNNRARSARLRIAERLQDQDNQNK